MKIWQDPESQETLLLMNLRHDLEKSSIFFSKFSKKESIQILLQQYKVKKLISYADIDLKGIVEQCCSKLGY